MKWKKTKFNYPYEVLEIGEGKEGIPLRSNYDLIICDDVLEHTPNPLEIVESFIEHLNPQGILSINFINAVGGPNLASANFQREEVKSILQERLIPIKAIDELNRNDGLYIKGDN